jgi:hypothetical protein
MTVLMNQKIQDKVAAIKESLQSAGLEISDRKNGIRVKSVTGYHIDIFTLTNHPEHIRARLKIKASDPLRRQAYVESNQNSLTAALEGVVRVEPFKLSRETGGVYVYNSVLMPGKMVFDEPPIEISEDAIEILDDGEPVNDAKDDDLEAFELNFDLEEDHRLKIVMSRAEEAVDKLKAVDAKMLRQSLDMMNLKRSSAVRLAVTRIFRSAAEVDELEKAIQNEAKKIVSPDDRAELQEVKSLSANGFLDPIVELLWQEVFNDGY